MTGERGDRRRHAGPAGSGGGRRGAAGGGGFPRLLPPSPGTGLRAHLGLHGPVPYRGGGALIGEVRAAGLTGRAIVVGNAGEGEPASHKDEALLFLAPHLVLGGLQLAAEAAGASRAVLCVRKELRARSRLTDYLPERDACGLDRVPVEVLWSPNRFLAGEESALASRPGCSSGPSARSPIARCSRCGWRLRSNTEVVQTGP